MLLQVNQNHIIAGWKVRKETEVVEIKIGARGKERRKRIKRLRTKGKRKKRETNKREIEAEEIKQEGKGREREPK